jgi:hypothetical protein
VFANPLFPESEGDKAEPKKSTPLTLEEKEIIENREMLENMELLEDLDKLLYLDLFKEDIQEEQKVKPETNKDAGKKK